MSVVKVLNIGSLNIDLVYRVAHIVKAGETLASLAHSRHAGGKGANQSVALAQAGLSVTHAGSIGEDAKWILEILRKKGVDTSLVRINPAQPSGHAFIQVSDEGENSIIIAGGANQQLRQRDIKEALTSRDWGALLLQNEVNDIAYIFAQARALDIPIFLNAAPYSKNLEKLALGDLHSLIVNETEAMELANTSNLNSAFATLQAAYPQIHLVMTMGGAGVRASHDGQEFFIPALSCEVQDTTAAGDTFVGYYMRSMLSNANIATAIKLANKAASIAVSRIGAIPSIPHIGELET